MDELIQKAAQHWAEHLEAYSVATIKTLYGHEYATRTASPDQVQQLINDLRVRRIRVEKPGSGLPARGWQDKVQGGLDALRSAIVGSPSPAWITAWRAK